MSVPHVWGELALPAPYPSGYGRQSRTYGESWPRSPEQEPCAPSVPHVWGELETKSVSQRACPRQSRTYGESWTRLREYAAQAQSVPHVWGELAGQHQVRRFHFVSPARMGRAGRNPSERSRYRRQSRTYGESWITPAVKVLKADVSPARMGRAGLPIR